MSQESLSADADVVSSIIRKRRSIKPADFSDRAVDRDVIQELLAAANWAPTHGMTEPWRFVVFTGDSRQALSDALAQIAQRILPDSDTRPAKIEKLQQNVRKAPCVLAVVMHRQPAGKIPEWEEISAVACAVQNLHLLATAMGLAGYWSSGDVLCHHDFAEYLGYSAPDRVLGLFYLGYPAKAWPEGTRTSLDHKVQWR